MPSAEGCPERAKEDETMNTSWIRRISATSILLAATTFGVAGTAHAQPRSCVAINNQADWAYTQSQLYFNLAAVWWQMGDAFKSWHYEDLGNQAFRRGVRLDQESLGRGC
jgi:hypothetical protein